MAKKKGNRVQRTDTELAKSVMREAKSAEQVSGVLLTLAKQVFTKLNQIPCVFAAMTSDRLVMLSGHLANAAEKAAMLAACRSEARRPGILGVGLAMEAVMTPLDVEATGPFATNCPVETIVTSGEWVGEDVHIAAVEIVRGKPPRVVEHDGWEGTIKFGGGYGVPVEGPAYDFLGQFSE